MKNRLANHYTIGPLAHLRGEMIIPGIYVIQIFGFNMNINILYKSVAAIVKNMQFTNGFSEIQ